jgi:hypothetical protein
MTLSFEDAYWIVVVWNGVQLQPLDIRSSRSRPVCRKKIEQRRRRRRKRRAFGHEDYEVCAWHEDYKVWAWQLA